MPFQIRISLPDDWPKHIAQLLADRLNEQELPAEAKAEVEERPEQ